MKYKYWEKVIAKYETEPAYQTIDGLIHIWQSDIITINGEFLLEILNHELTTNVNKKKIVDEFIQIQNFILGVSND